MTIRCGLCGKEIKVADNLGDGQHVRCPYCGEKSEFHRPVRMKIPSVAIQSPQEKKAPLAKSQDKKAVSPQIAPGRSKEAHKLSIIRPAAPRPQNTEVNNESNKSRPQNVEAKNESNRNPVRPRRSSIGSKEHPIYYSVAILVAGITTVAILMLNHHEKKEMLLQEQLARQSDFERKEIEEKRREEREQAARKRAEDTRREKEAKRLAEEEKRQEKERARQAAYAAKKAAEKESRRQLEELQANFSQVKGLKIDYWRNCPNGIRPQTVEQRKEYICFLPRDLNSTDCMKIVAMPGGEMSIQIYDKDGVLSPMSNDVFFAEIERSPYLICEGGNGWICGIEDDEAGVPIRGDSSAINPAKEELGLLYEFLRGKMVKADNIYYGVSFVDKNGHREFVRRVKFGDSVSASDVKPIVRGYLQYQSNAKRGGTKTSEKQFKRTVVFSNVAQITRRITGVIEIPYVCPAYKGYGVDCSYSWSESNGSPRRGGPMHRGRRGRGGRGRPVERTYFYSRSSTNASGAREREYMNLRAIAEKEDAEEAAWKCRQAGFRSAESHFEIDERDVEKVLFSGKFFFTSIR